MSFFDNELEFKGNKTLAGVLQDFGNDLQESLRRNLASKVKGFSSKQLEQSIVFDINISGGGYRFELKLADYYKYLDKGVQGKSGQRKSDSKFTGEKAGSMFQNKAPGSEFSFKTKRPPIEPLRLFANVAGLNVYALRESIFQKGIAPNHFYSEIVTPDLINDLINDISKAYKKAIEIELVDTFKGELNGK